MIKNIENHTVKISFTVAIFVILFIIAQVAQVTAWKTAMEIEQTNIKARQEYLNNCIETITNNIEDLEKIANGRDVQIATINTKLANIETLLLEIKQDLKEN